MSCFEMTTHTIAIRKLNPHRCQTTIKIIFIFYYHLMSFINWPLVSVMTLYYHKTKTKTPSYIGGVTRHAIGNERTSYFHIRDIYLLLILNVTVTGLRLIE